MLTGKPSAQGLVPSNFNGQWHGDTLTLGTDFVIWKGTATESSTANPDQYPPTMVAFKRGELDAYRAACAQLS